MDDTLTDFDKIDLFRCQLAWEAGDSLAIVGAVHICQEFHEPLPRWLTDAITELVDRRMSGDERREQTDLKMHTLRWHAVMVLRGPKRLSYDHGKLCEVDVPKLTWEKCWSGAAEMLEGTAFRGSAATIRASYMLIKHAGGERATLESYRAELQRRRKQQQIKTRANT
jgi:hypothetical protein